MKDPRKSLAQIHESYVKNPEKICVDSTAWSRESYKKDLENSHDDSTGLAISYKGKKTAAA